MTSLRLSMLVTLLALSACPRPAETCEEAGNCTGGGSGGASGGGSGGGSNSGGGTGGGAPSLCGNGNLDVGESCDDRNANAGDGCGVTCLTEPGWVCIPVGAGCTAAACGDGIVAGLEECDDDDTQNGDGCSANCQIEQGWACDGGTCTRTICGNGVVEGIEQCDDGNNSLGDGCDTQCHREPKCTNGTCLAVCGDGVWATSEACDDGNQRDGDGCSHTCQRETGFECTPQLPAAAQSLAIPIVYRDFLPGVFNGDGGTGHPDFDWSGIAGETGDDRGIVEDVASVDGKPVYAHDDAGTQTTHGPVPFNQWYRDTPGVNRTVPDTLTVTRQGNGSYVFEDTTFFPLDGRGWQDADAGFVERSRRASNGGATCNQPNSFNDCHNFNFTSELRYWFTFSGGERLEFFGDDDVFVFVNGHLAVDIGGIHGQEDGNVTLDAQHATDFELADGGVYEAVVFQAERHVTGSNYKLTLQGFNAPRAVCISTCGDGIVTRDEACDDGPSGNDGGYGQCGADCKMRGGYCGDGTVQVGHEQCDPAAPDAGSCGPTCHTTSCGDGFVQDGEECDDGNTISQDGCSSTCHVEIG
jgi:fibro-slime domain-containing protein